MCAVWRGAGRTDHRGDRAVVPPQLLQLLRLPQEPHGPRGRPHHQRAGPAPLRGLRQVRLPHQPGRRPHEPRREAGRAARPGAGRLLRQAGGAPQGRAPDPRGPPQGPRQGGRQKTPHSRRALYHHFLRFQHSRSHSQAFRPSHFFCSCFYHFNYHFIWCFNPSFII